MPVFKCKMCGAPLDVVQGNSICKCDYCGSTQTIPKLETDKRANLYDRADHYRRANDYDKAMSVYEKILDEDTSDAEAYWSIVLCRYGIEYVEDPKSHTRIPTVNRVQKTSILADEDYKEALKYADADQRAIYEAEAKAIEVIQKGILEISSKEKPYDVFICYKETDDNGRRTQDSVLAQDLYYQLTGEGFKVFFSRITLEDKLGTAYEPYIFAALNSAKVMVVVGTKPEYFNAVWVKNEWSRYLALMQDDPKKVLVPAYKDMDPYDIPEELSHLQAQDMSKLGFMQDLVRGIKKLIVKEEPKTVVKTTIVENASGVQNIDALLRRAELFLEDRDFASANEYADKVLDIEPECAEAYLVKLLADLKLDNRTKLDGYKDPSYMDNVNYKKILRFGDDAIRSEMADYAENTNRNVQIIEGVTYKILKDGSGYYCERAVRNVQSVNIPSVILGLPVKKIEKEAFNKCSSLTNVTIPNSVTIIANYAFSECTALSSVSMPDGVTSIGKYAFYDCSKLANIIIPDSVKQIGEYAFYGCHMLANIVIPGSVTSIGDMAFSECNALTSIAIPSSVKSIGEYLLDGCNALRSITLPYCPNKIYELFGGSTNDTPTALSEVIITGGTAIGDRAFMGCASIQSIKLPQTATSIGREAFNMCSALTSISIPNGVTSIGERAFWNCESLTSIAIPDSVTSIGDEAFLNTGIKNICMPAQFKSLSSKKKLGLGLFTKVTSNK